MARMNRLLTRLLVALALVFVSAPAMAQWQVAAHAVPIGKGPGVIGFGSATAGASGTVFLGKGTTTDPAFVALSQDCTVVSTGVITCTKTNNVSFAPSATTDTTNAANISSGLLPNARLDAEVQCIAGLTSAADKIAYFTGLGTCALADFSAAERTYLTTSSSANLRAVLTDETGTGLAYFQGGALGTPSSGTATNLTGLPIAGITGLGTGVGTWLATPSSANLATAITDETGSGALVFGTAPQISTIELGNASDTTISRTSAGDIAIEGNGVYRAGGTDVALADGGSGASTAPLARVNFNIDQKSTQGDANYTILSTDRTVVTTVTLTAARTDTLPAASAVNAGQHIVVADMFGAINGANTLTVQRAGSDTINGVTSAALTAQYGYIDLVSDGTSKWTYQAAAGGGSGTVTNATIAAGTGIAVSGTCAITTSGTCTVSQAAQDRQNALLDCADMSKALVAAIRRIETYCDGFKNTDGATPTNATIDTTNGKVGPTTSAGSARLPTNMTTNTAPSPNVASSTTVAGSQSPYLMFDGSNSTFFQTTTPGGTETLKIDLGSGNAVTFASYSLTSASTLGAQMIKTWTFEGSNDNSSWTTLDTQASQTAWGSAETRTFTLSVTSAAYRYLRLQVTAGNTVSNYVVGTWQATGPLIPNNMTVVSTSQTADATVTGGRVLAEVDPIDSITINTDLTGEITCNGGTNWTSAPLSSAGKGQSGRTVYESADTTCSNSGTSFAARWKTANNKSVNIYKSTVTVH